MRPDDEGWMVHNVRIDESVRVKCVRQTGLDIAEADDLVDLLKRLALWKGEDAPT